MVLDVQCVEVRPLHEQRASFCVGGDKKDDEAGEKTPILAPSPPFHGMEVRVGRPCDGLRGRPLFFPYASATMCPLRCAAMKYASATS